MTVGAPEITMIGDLRDCAITEWNGKTVVVATGIQPEIGYRFGAEPLYTFREIRLPAPEKMRRIAAVVYGNELMLAWGEPIAGNVRFCKFDLLARALTLNPVTVSAGTEPALVVYGNSRVLISYTRAAQHRAKSSTNLGVTWSVERTVDAGNSGITASDVATEDPSGLELIWAETDIP